jgi:type II secretory pathway pseudopilin PulG
MNLKSGGFSLLQTVVVFAIIILISSFSFPKLVNYNQSLQLRNSAKLIVEKLRTAQQLTVTSQNKYSLRFSPLSNIVSLIKKTTPETVIETFTLNTDVLISEISNLLNDEVVFNSAGAVEHSGEVTLAHNKIISKILIEIKPSGYVTWNINNE